MKISMIACIGKNLELGKNNDLIWHLPNDLKFFKKTTDGKVVVMGKNTFLSLPKILPNRTNVVLTYEKNDKDLKDFKGLLIFTNIEELFEYYKNFKDEIFIIGGASIYKQFLEYADKLYLTEVDEICQDATVYFPYFDKSLYNREVLDQSSDGEIKYQYVLYRRK